MKMTAAKKIFLVSLILAVLGLSASVFLISKMVIAEKSYAVILKKGGEDAAKRNTEAGIVKLMSSVSDDAKIAESRVLDNESVVPYLENLGTVAKQIGVAFNVDTINLDAGSGLPDGYENMKIVARVIGRYGDVLRMLGVMENGFYAASIERVGLSKDVSDKAAKADWTGSISFNVVKKK